jgi:hypothetical protein
MMNAVVEKIAAEQNPAEQKRGLHKNASSAIYDSRRLEEVGLCADELKELVETDVRVFESVSTIVFNHKLPTAILALRLFERNESVGRK